MTPRILVIAGAALAAAAAGLVAAPPASAACGTGPYSGGDGSVGDPYEISSGLDLTALRGTSGDWSCSFVLTTDLDMGSATWTAVIGNGTTQFTGNFNGGGFEISNLTINGSGDYWGLFGYADSSAHIRNVTFNGSVSGGSATGGLVGSLRDSAKVTNSSTAGTVTSTGSNVGGLVGQVNTTGGVEISGSFSTTAVTSASGSAVGGLVGGFASSGLLTLVNSFSTGAVVGDDNVGGLIGSVTGSSTTVTNSYSTGAVTGNTDLGGLIGSTNTPDVGYTASYWDTETSGIATSAGGANVVGKTTAQMRDVATYGAWSIQSGGLGSTWGICSAVNNGYPFLTAFYSSDPCSGGGGGDSGVSSRQPTYTFTFLTSGGGRCFDDVTVTRSEGFTLPPSTVACTPLGTSLVGWSIPGQDWAFHPGRVVTVVGSQTFTAVAREPRVDVTYDSNINMVDECVREGANITIEADRMDMVETPRSGPSALLATSAPCSPPGFELIGWTNANTPNGSGAAQEDAQTYEPGAAVPEAWNVESTNPVNTIRLFALWGRAAS